MRMAKVARPILASVLLLAVGLSAQESTSMVASKIDVSKRGPQVGEPVPDFSLRDQNGRMQTLQSIIGAKGAMLVFVRSADW